MGGVLELSLTILFGMKIMKKGDFPMNHYQRQLSFAGKQIDIRRPSDYKRLNAPTSLFYGMLLSGKTIC